MGIFSLVLHTHLPYVRRNGVWPSGEDFFHQAAVESYLPLLGVLQRMADRGARDALTIGLSPMVAHQMQDPHMLAELGGYLARWELRALRQVANYDGVFASEFRELAAFYARFGREQAARLDAAPAGIASGFGAVAAAGAVEILGGPATHPYLPLVSEPSLAEAQVRLGVAEHKRLLGRTPRGMWLPECAYRPGAGLEDLLAGNGVGHLVVDGPTMLRSAGSTFLPARIGASEVVAFGRNLDVTYRVWSPNGGYPTGRWYRDFYHYDLEAGFKDWRVTSVRKPVERKRPYEPERARAAARRDAQDFVELVTRTLDAHERESGVEGVVVAAYDTELFGHWWFEGPAFLEHVYELLDAHPTVRPLSLAGAVDALPEALPVALQAGSWGFRKDERSWVAEETLAMREALAEVESDTVKIAFRHRDAAGARAAALAQLLREALLCQASDWPFMVLRGRNPDYARERFEAHRGRWTHLAGLLRRNAPDDVLEREARTLHEIDNVLPGLGPDAIG